MNLAVEVLPGHALDKRYGYKEPLLEETDMEPEVRPVTFTMTEDVFRLEAGNLGLATCYVDCEGRIVSSPEDAFRILNIPESRRLFLLSQKDLFLSAVKEMHS